MVEQTLGDTEALSPDLVLIRHEQPLTPQLTSLIQLNKMQHIPVTLNNIHYIQIYVCNKENSYRKRDKALNIKG